MALYMMVAFYKFFYECCPIKQLFSKVFQIFFVIGNLLLIHVCLYFGLIYFLLILIDFLFIIIYFLLILIDFLLIFCHSLLVIGNSLLIICYLLLNLMFSVKLAHLFHIFTFTWVTCSAVLLLSVVLQFFYSIFSFQLESPNLSSHFTHIFWGLTLT